MYVPNLDTSRVYRDCKQVHDVLLSSLAGCTIINGLYECLWHFQLLGIRASQVKERKIDLGTFGLTCDSASGYAHVYLLVYYVPLMAVSPVYDYVISIV